MKDWSKEKEIENSRIDKKSRMDMMIEWSKEKDIKNLRMPKEKKPNV